MIDRTDNKEIVVVGAWNFAIFTEEWMRKYILEAEKNIMVQTAIGLSAASLRFFTDDYSFVIIGNRLEIASLTHTAQSYEKIIEVLRKICRLLPHTPITAMGLNIGLIVDNCELAQHNNFTQADTSVIKTYLGIVEEPVCNIQRAFKVSPIESLNLTASCHGDIGPDKILFDFNYNYSVNNIETITSIVIGDTNELIIKKHKASVALLNAVYGVEI